MGTEAADGFPADGFPADGEGPVREVAVAPFRIAPTTVTNAQYATLRQGHRTCHGSRGLRFLLRLRRPARGGGRRHRTGRGGGSVVAGGVRRDLEGRGPQLRHPRQLHVQHRVSGGRLRVGQLVWTTRPAT
ncbi:hypothetical protein [Streptomyces sp. AP-93]|uniref:hypothetical protein n=1 Tax=Streptomyces sp. AP-93 TaxID=2929048 RepID=UPI0035AF59B2